MLSSIALPTYTRKDMVVDRLPSRIFIGLLLLVAVPLILLQTFTPGLHPTAATWYSAPPVIAIPTTVNTAPSTIGGLGNVNVVGVSVPCLGTPETPKDMFRKLFGITEYQKILSSKYQKTIDKVLCADRYPWRTTVSLRWSDIIATLGWPGDLIQDNMRNMTTTVRPLSQVDPDTEKKQSEKANPPPNKCELEVSGTWIRINICELRTKLIKTAIIEPILALYTNVLQQANGFIWTTPGKYTYDLEQNKPLQYFHTLSLALVSAYVFVVIAWVGLRYIMGSSISWLSYAELQESLPRIAFGMIAAYLAMPLAATIIDSSNVLASLFHGDMLRHLADIKESGVAYGLVQAVYALMGILFVIESSARYAVLTVILAFFPLLLFSAALKELSHIASGAIKGLILFTFLQPIQLAILDLGQVVLVNIVKTGDKGNILLYLMGIGIMVLCLWMFFVIASTAFGGMFSGASAGLFGAQAAGLAWGGRKLLSRLAPASNTSTTTSPTAKSSPPLTPRTIPGPTATVPPIVAASGVPVKSMPSASTSSGSSRMGPIVRFVGGRRTYSGSAASTIHHTRAGAIPSPTPKRSTRKGP